jgi:hypothetical protein
MELKHAFSGLFIKLPTNSARLYNNIISLEDADVRPCQRMSAIYSDSGTCIALSHLGKICMLKP